MHIMGVAKSQQSLDTSKLRKHIENFQIRELFIESLGWDNPSTGLQNEMQLNGKTVSYSCIAEKSNVPVLLFESKIFNQFENQFDKKKFHQKIKETHTKHIALFKDEENFFYISYLSKEGHVRDHHSYFKGQNSDDFISKLANIHFLIDDTPQIAEIGIKLEKAFDTEKITKRFFEDFKNNHLNFQKYISGINNTEEKKWYASLILNRLMFIWFIQKKGFINNEDYNYLQNKLEDSKTRSSDKYYSEFLTLLFFEGFAKKSKERSEKAKKLLGNIRYLNGGLFVPHPIEEKYKKTIQIPDKAFEKTFEIFSNYEWHLQDSRGKSNEISPDVMGYIFEKYINELQQKSLGAYYTRDEITKYLSKNTIQNCILDKVNQQGYDFKSRDELLGSLDAKLCKLILTNEDSILNNLTILDPAVGSGAFLVSAMKELIDIYSPILGKIEILGDRELKKWYEDFKIKHKSISYGIKRHIILKNLYGVDIMKEAAEVCKLRLFLSLVSSALNEKELEPLPNMDFNIMHGNSLIGFLRADDKEGVEQKVKQNKKQEAQTAWSEILGESYKQIKERYNKLVSQYKSKALSFEKIKELKHKILDFLDENNSKLNLVLADKCNQRGVSFKPIIDIQGKKKVFGKKRPVSPESFFSEEDSRNLNPFHWDFAFNEIMAKGGFDVIITNPPWEKVKIEDREFFYKYDDSIEKKKTKKEVMKRKKIKLLKNPHIKKDYLKTEEFYCFQRAYFSKLYQYQSGKIIETDEKTKQASSDVDTYRLFLERSFDLLNKGGFVGIVIPSGLYKDEGAIALRRKLLFDKVKIEGLIDFQNQMNNGKGKIFEGVDPRFKFLLLNFKKDKPQDKFPCQFHLRDLKILDENQFPKNPKMTQSIKEIKELSPRDCSIIELKNPRDKGILKKTSQFPTIGKKITNSWNPVFYTEFHETNDSHLFKNKKLSDSYLPLYKGKVIYQYKFNHDLSHVDRYVNKEAEKVKTGKGFSFKNECYKNYRLVIRTIASNTNERSLISTVIPKNHFISNSLYGVHIESKNSHQNNRYMLLLQAFFNSFVVDYFIRQKVSANINKKYITPLHIPRLTEKDNYFKELVERSAKLTCIGKEFDELADEIGIARGGITNQEERWKIQGEIDAIAAYIYGLTKKEFWYILDTFNTGKNKERLESLKKYARSAYEKDQFLSKAI